MLLYANAKLSSAAVAPPFEWKPITGFPGATLLSGVSVPYLHAIDKNNFVVSVNSSAVKSTAVVNGRAYTVQKEADAAPSGSWLQGDTLYAQEAKGSACFITTYKLQNGAFVPVASVPRALTARKYDYGQLRRLDDGNFMIGVPYDNPTILTPDGAIVREVYPSEGFTSFAYVPTVDANTSRAVGFQFTGANSGANSTWVSLYGILHEYDSTWTEQRSVTVSLSVKTPMHATNGSIASRVFYHKGYALIVSVAYVTAGKRTASFSIHTMNMATRELSEPWSSVGTVFGDEVPGDGGRMITATRDYLVIAYPAARNTSSGKLLVFDKDSLISGSALMSKTLGNSNISAANDYFACGIAETYNMLIGGSSSGSDVVLVDLDVAMAAAA